MNKWASMVYDFSIYANGKYENTELQDVPLDEFKEIMISALAEKGINIIESGPIVLFRDPRPRYANMIECRMTYKAV